MGLNRDPEFIKKIENSIDSMRPYLVADGGDVELYDVTDEMVVKLRFIGNCSSCKMSTMTLKAGMEQTIMKSIPEIKAVEAVE